MEVQFLEILVSFFVFSVFSKVVAVIMPINKMMRDLHWP